MAPSPASRDRLAQGLRLSRSLRLAPLVLFLAVVGALIWRLSTPVDTTVHSNLEGKPVPAFKLAPALETKPTVSSDELATGKPRLVNFFASWCLPCISEVKVLQQLQRSGVAIDGIAIRDRPQDLTDFLMRNGDPYERIGSDPRSEVQIALGSSGVPESFVVDGRGIIRYQHIGAIEPADVPGILAKLRAVK